MIHTQSTPGGKRRRRLLLMGSALAHTGSRSVKVARYCVRCAEVWCFSSTCSVIFFSIDPTSHSSTPLFTYLRIGICPCECQRRYEIQHWSSPDDIAQASRSSGRGYIRQRCAIWWRARYWRWKHDPHAMIEWDKKQPDCSNRNRSLNFVRIFCFECVYDSKPSMKNVDRSFISWMTCISWMFMLDAF